MTPVEILLPFSAGLAMVATVNFVHNAYNGMNAIARQTPTLHSSSQRRHRDKEFNAVIWNIYLAVFAALYAIAGFFLTGALFD